jgi:hypothetical protein
MGLNDCVEMHRWSGIDHLPELYARCHFVLVPSRATPTWAEQFGRVIVEAQACGAVVVGYASGAIPETGGDAAVLVPEGSVDLLWHEIARLCCDAAEWSRRRELGLETAATRSWDRVVGRQLDLYENVISRPTRMALPRGKEESRRIARREFGGPASTPVGFRPFAFPPLRNWGRLSRALGAVIDFADTAWKGILRCK